jgi:hypothetical protein
LVILPTDLAGNPSFSQLLESVRETCISVYDHSDLPLYQLMELLYAEMPGDHEAKAAAMQHTDDIGYRIDRAIQPTGAGEPYFFFAVQTSDRTKKVAQQRLAEQFQMVDMKIDRLVLPLSEIVPGPGVSVTAEEIAEGLQLKTISEVDRYRSETMVEFLDLYQLVLETIIADPETRLSDLVTLVRQKREDRTTHKSTQNQSAVGI